MTLWLYVHVYPFMLMHSFKPYVKKSCLSEKKSVAFWPSFGARKNAESSTVSVSILVIICLQTLCQSFKSACTLRDPWLKIDAKKKNQCSCWQSKPGTGDAWKRVLNQHNIRLSIKLRVYNAVILLLILNGCESWTLFCRYIDLKNFTWALCSIFGIQWQITLINNLEVCHLHKQWIQTHQDLTLMGRAGQGMSSVWRSTTCLDTSCVDSLPVASDIKADHRDSTKTLSKPTSTNATSTWRSWRSLLWIVPQSIRPLPTLKIPSTHYCQRTPSHTNSWQWSHQTPVSATLLQTVSSDWGCGAISLHIHEFDDT